MSDQQTSDEYDDISLKILVVGKLACGKTSIIQRFCHDEFQSKYKPTIGVDFHTKEMEVMNIKVILQLWDIAGQERFGHMTRVYFQNADGALVVFDATRVATFHGAKEWKDDIDDCFSKDALPTVLLANKSDLPQTTIPDDIEEFCEQNGFLNCFKTSAKDGTGITEALTDLVTKILKNHMESVKKAPEEQGFKLTDKVPSQQGEPTKKYEGINSFIPYGQFYPEQSAFTLSFKSNNSLAPHTSSSRKLQIDQQSIVSYPKKDCVRHAFYWTFLCFWMACPLFIWVSVGFNGIPWYGGAILMTFLWLTGFFTIMKQVPTYRKPEHSGFIFRYITSVYAGIKALKWYWITLAVIGFTAVAFIMCVFTFNLCVALYPFRVTSQISRQIDGVSCPSGKVCNFILTVPQDLRVSMIVNYQSNDLPVRSFALLDTVSHGSSLSSKTIPVADFINPYANTINSTFFKMDNIVEEDRYVHWADLLGLIPGTTYYVSVGYEANGNIYLFEERKFRTAPGDSSTAVTYITGGDMAVSEVGNDLSKHAAETEPLFAMVGGDLAYDDGFCSCYRVWDNWFDKWNQYLQTPTGYTVPLIGGIGNHESSGWKSKASDVQFYTRYLAFQTGLQSMDPLQRPTYHSHAITADIFIVVLDSWVVTPISDQNQFLESALSSSAAKFKFGIYHIAVYPSTYVKADYEITISARDNWSPIFDRYNLTVAYENHYHLYKRSKPLLGGEENPLGTVYMGDGAWGATTILKVKDYDYIEVAHKLPHMIRTIITPTSNTIQVDTIGQDGDFIDHWNRTV
ncbi:hypothetical protein PPL_01956 [Heterostelium album PN500]|uniref:Purple acid phosphatase N-terminal domain-containing protein n=1 Tax=Heterostelium pallidum (strain ATCC 26659 / Pp 5 / PN500) TaxID=670386 RepID=D3B0Y9_HETP5|nr:hypothetical protein PPL_01956 [Heterostelium album PN500]EFA84963.1 hypothetical protein PPL_01956 [Heterostelium album PN500]|eukprot:XP_020437073.1 hypothetical protein PPL_01956 [Heterostelium album PN500]